jgi:hypothetical protein
MSRQMSLPQNFKIVQMIPPKTTNAALTSQVVSLKGVNKAWVIFEFTQAVGFASTPTLLQATSIGAGTNKAGPSVPIWANEDTATTDTLVKQASDAASYAVTNNIKNKEVVFEIDPSRLDSNNLYDYIYFTLATSSQATNFVSATAILQTSYQQSTPPTQIA